MNHHEPPTYQVPRADGGRIPDPGRGWRCLLIVALGIVPLSSTIGSVYAILIEHRDIGVKVGQLFTDFEYAGEFILPGLALMPFIGVALVRNMQAWIAPTSSTVALANRWLQRLRWAVLWAVLIGIGMCMWLLFWLVIHPGVG